MARETVICVLGMHRSGTSCLMGCLEEAGLFAGEVVQKAPHNAKGNRENLAIRDLNDEVMGFSAGSWREPPASLSWNQIHVECRQRIIDSYFAQSSIWGFKDPRTVLTLDFWREALPGLLLVGTFRHPIAVANSLFARDRMPLQKGLALWERYNSIILAEFERAHFPIVCFDDEPQCYLASVQAVIEKIGLPPRGVSAMSFFSNLLRHEGNSIHDDGAIGAGAAAIYNRLRQAARA